MPHTKQHHSLDLAALAWDIASVPYSVARADALDRIRESGPDVAVEEDEGGGVHAVHDLAAFRDGEGGDTGIVRGVPVLELATFTDPLATIGEIAHLVRELEGIGAKPCVKFSRNSAGRINGMVVCRELVA
jgi:hypothetical protein